MMEVKEHEPYFTETKRCGMAVYIKNLKNIRQLRYYGTIYYVSKKMKYVMLYVDEDKKDEVAQALEKQNFVRKVWLSEKPNIKVDYQKERGE